MPAQLANHAAPGDKPDQSAHRRKARLIGSHCSFITVKRDELTKWPVDLPEQHGGTGKGAALSGIFAIDDRDVAAVAGQALSDERTGDAGADNQDFA